MSQSINFHAEIDEFALVSNEKTLLRLTMKLMSKIYLMREKGSQNSLQRFL